MGRQKFQVGEYTYTMEKFKVDELLPNDKILGPDPTADFLQTVVSYGIIRPITYTSYKGELHLIDGGRRIKACRMLAIPEIVAQVFEEVPPFDQAAWSVILNQQRSLNPIAEYRYLSKLKKDDIDEFYRVTRTTRAHVEKVMRLDNLDKSVKQDFIDATENGKIAEGTLWKIANESKPRQKYLKTVLKEKDKITAKDVKAARQARSEAVLEAAADTVFKDNVPKSFTPEYIFAIFSDNEGLAGPWYDFHDAHQEALSRGGDWKAYRLVEV